MQGAQIENDQNENKSEWQVDITQNFDSFELREKTLEDSQTAETWELRRSACINDQREARKMWPWKCEAKRSSNREEGSTSRAAAKDKSLDHHSPR